jgi:hypothetical protein
MRRASSEIASSASESGRSASRISPKSWSARTRMGVAGWLKRASSSRRSSFWSAESLLEERPQIEAQVLGPEPALDLEEDGDRRGEITRR